MRTDILIKQKETDLRFRQEVKFRPIIDDINKNQQPRSRIDDSLLEEWNAFSKEERKAIQNAKKNARSVSRFIKSWCDAFSVLLVGCFTAKQIYIFCAMNMDLQHLLYSAPFIFPASRIRLEVDRYLSAHPNLERVPHHQVTTIVDIDTGLEWNPCDPKNSPGNESSAIGAIGDAVITCRLICKLAKAEWQNIKSMPQPFSPYGGKFCNQVRRTHRRILSSINSFQLSHPSMLGMQ